MQSTLGHFRNDQMTYFLFALSSSLCHTELDPFLAVYLRHRMSAPVLHHLLFYIRADWMQPAGREGCSGSSLRSHGHQSKKEPCSIHFHTEFLNAPSCNIQPDHIVPLHASSITTLTPREKAEVSLLTTSTRASCLIHLL